MKNRKSKQDRFSKAIRAAIWSSGMAVLLGFVLACIGAYYEKEGPGFWSGLELNLAPEFIGTGVSVLLGALVADWLATRRVDKISYPLLNFIRVLRESKGITPEQTREFVICAVGLLDEERLSDERIKNNNQLPHQGEFKCNICTLRVNANADSSGMLRCEHCKAPGVAWI